MYSCATESNIFDGTKFSLAKNDKLYLLDSFEVVQVIDNRNLPDSIIGEADYDDRPLILNRPLKDYIKMSLNTLMKTDTSQSAKIPVNVYIDEFYSGRYIDAYSHCSYNKYSYLFEYPYNNKINKLRIMDSMNVCDGEEIYLQKMLIRSGIRNTARFFQYNHFKNYPMDTTKQNTTTSEESKKDIDTIDLYQIFKFDTKSGAIANIYKGFKVDYGIQFTYIVFYTRPNIKYEFGRGIAVQFSEVSNGDITGKSLSFSIPIIHRFNFSPQKNGFFIDLSYSLGGQTENTKDKFNGFYFGTKLKQSIGYYISDSFSVTAGFYQEGYIKAKLLPYDFGMFLSLNITNTYF